MKYVHVYICTMYSFIHKYNKNFKEILAPSKYPNHTNPRFSTITKCNECDICRNYMIFHKTIKFTVTRKVYHIKGELKCESKKWNKFDNEIYEMLRTICCFCFKF